MKTFKDFLLPDYILKSLEGQNIINPTEIQEKVIPLLLQKQHTDLFGQAQTGTGKTLAFGIPLLECIDANNKSVQAIVVVPTRELCVQVTQSLAMLGKFCKLRIEPIYGGASMQKQIKAIKQGAQIIVGTPGRINDHLRSRTLALKGIRTLVLDEADIMLDMGFRKDIDAILKHCPENRQIWLFSATSKPGINELMHSHMKNPEVVRVSKQQVSTQSVEQYLAIVYPGEQFMTLCQFIDSAEDFYGMVFVQTKRLAADLSTKLAQRQYRVQTLHGDMSQDARNRVTAAFKRKDFTILVATDVAARGIDIPDLTHVINYSLPFDTDGYVHRIGRTGRAGKQGIAITLVQKRELYRIKRIEKQFNIHIKMIQPPSQADQAQRKFLSVQKYLHSISAQRKANNPQVQSMVEAFDRDQLTSTVMHLINEKFFVAAR